MIEEAIRMVYISCNGMGLYSLYESNLNILLNEIGDMISHGNNGDEITVELIEVTPKQIEVAEAPYKTS